MKFKTLSAVILGILLIIPITFAKDFEVSVDVSPKEMSVGPYGIATFDMNIQNLGGKKDTYGITVEGIPEDWYSLSYESVELDAGSSSTVYLFITPYYVKHESFTGTVSVIGRSNDTDTFTLGIIPDHEIKVSLPRIISSCLCEEDEVTILVENLGEKYSEDIVLTVSGDALEIVELKAKSFTLGPTEKKNIPLKISSACGEEERSYSLEVKAKSESSYAESTFSSVIKKIKCYDFKVSFPPEIRACTGVETSFEIGVENTGIKEDSYEITIEKANFSELIAMKPGDTKVSEVSIKEDEFGVYDFVFIVKSKFAEVEGTIKFVTERCYGVEIELDEKELSIKSGTGKLTKPRITNVGTKKDGFEVSADMGWVSIKPSQLELEPNETKNVFVYYSPEYGLMGVFNVTLKVWSENSRDEKMVKVSIEETEVVTTTIVEEETTTTAPAEPIIPTGFLPKILKNKIIMSLVIGFIVALIILGLIYLVVMRG